LTRSPGNRVKIDSLEESAIF